MGTSNVLYRSPHSKFHYISGERSFCFFHPTKLDIAINIFLLTVATVISFALIVHFFLVKELRQKPGDIMIMLSIGEFISTVSQIILTYCCTFQDKPIHETFHQIPSFLIIFMENVINFYHISFCLFHLNVLKNAVRGSKTPHMLYHLGPWIMTALCMYFSTLLRGSDAENSPFESTDVLSSIIKYSMLVFLITNFGRYIKLYLPPCQKVMKVEMQFLNYYEKYLKLLRFIYIARCLIELGTNLMISQDIDERKIKLFGVILTASHIITGAMPSVLSLVRFNDPWIRKYWSSFFQKELGNLETIRNSSKKWTHNLLEKSLKFKPQIVQIQYSRKIQVVYSILAGIHYFWHMRETNQLKLYSKQTDIPMMDNFEDTKHCRKEFKVKQVMQIHKNSLKKEVPHIYNEIHKNGYNFAQGKLTIYTPKVFDKIIDMDDAFKGISESLDLKENLPGIASSGVNKAGKSGEFFFFSKDNKFVVKTISKKELDVFLKILPSLMDHFVKNPNTLLTKIYGLFSFKLRYSQENFHFILMNNINHCPQACLCRKYDLKGSTVGRRTVKDDDVPRSELIKHGTLKELDFEKYENKLSLREDLKENFLNVVQKDADFLQSLGLLDYSLMLYVIDKTLCTHQEKNGNNSGERENSSNKYKLSCFESMKDDVYYRVGIIDYLTEYGIKKKLEVFFKKLLALNPNRNISAQQPKFYAERFVDYVKNMIE